VNISPWERKGGDPVAWMRKNQWAHKTINVDLLAGGTQNLRKGRKNTKGFLTHGTRGFATRKKKEKRSYGKGYLKRNLETSASREYWKPSMDIKPKIQRENDSGRGKWEKTAPKLGLKIRRQYTTEKKV